jgi:hypothetical protein
MAFFSQVMACFSQALPLPWHFSATPIFTWLQNAMHNQHPQQTYAVTKKNNTHRNKPNFTQQSCNNHKNYIYKNIEKQQQFRLLVFAVQAWKLDNQAQILGPKRFSGERTRKTL